MTSTPPPATPGPATPGPATPGPAWFGPATPGPARFGPATPAPGLPEPAGPGPAPRLTVRSSTDLIAVVPYLLGFHPTDSLTVVALRRQSIVFVARTDLPGLDTPPAARAAAVAQLAAGVARQRVDAAVLAGYGAADRVGAVLPAVRAALADRQVPVRAALRVADGRIWSLLCADACCPADGVPYDPRSSAVAAAATVAGHVALPDRAALVAQLAPVTGPGREAMHRATARAESRLDALLGDAALADLLGGRAVRAAGEASVDAALTGGRRAARLADDEAAWLTVLLRYLPVRDHAWERVGPDDWQLDLWSDLTRRAEPDHVAAPASLLAFAAWRTGRGALASVALDRALADDPGYAMARLLRDAVDQGLPPAAVGSWPLTRATGRAAGRRSGRRTGHGRAAYYRPAPPGRALRLRW
ncbi:MAG TPA: DUF4192 domain-containing protein [Pilimelia sp.]|nr:DUF4192 domain-containing protein [Pilimelia sp.]